MHVSRIKWGTNETLPNNNSAIFPSKKHFKMNELDFAESFLHTTLYSAVHSTLHVFVILPMKNSVKIKSSQPSFSYVHVVQ